MHSGRKVRKKERKKEGKKERRKKHFWRASFEFRMGSFQDRFKDRNKFQKNTSWVTTQIFSQIHSAISRADALLQVQTNELIYFTYLLQNSRLLAGVWIANISAWLWQPWSDGQRSQAKYCLFKLCILFLLSTLLQREPGVASCFLLRPLNVAILKTSWICIFI
jgi:hypothetical protein